MEIEAPPDPARALEDSLLDLVDELRRADFRVGVGEVLRAQELLVALAGRGLLPCAPTTLRHYLAPLFCSKPAEQEQFYARFGDWLIRHPEARAQLVREEADDDALRRRGEDTWKGRRGGRRRPDLAGAQSPGLLRLAALAAGLLLIVLAASVAAALLTVPPNPTLSGVVVEAGGGPVAGADVTFAERSVQTGPDGRFSLTYEAQPGNDDLVILHQEFDPWRKALATDDSAPSVEPVTIELTRRLAPPVVEPPLVEPPPADSSAQPAPDATPLAPPQHSAPTLTDDDRQRFREALERINAFAETSRVAEPLSGWRRLYFLYYNWVRGLAVGLPVLFAGLWGAWSWYRRRLVLKQRAAGKLPEADRIVVQGARAAVFASERLRRMSQKFRAHSGVPSRELEGAATVHRTARRAGLFTPVYGIRQVRPEYLALIDRADFADHQAEYFDALLARLAAEGVFVSRYFFDGDPRLCFGPQPDAPPLSLPELAAKHADDRVMIFSEGAGFINDLSGRPQALVENFAPWGQKALFTPRAAPHWGSRERSLAEWGFHVLHAGEEGLEAFIETVQTGEAVAPAPRVKWDPPYPPILAERPARWLGRRAPEEVDGEVLDAQLRYFLGEDGYYWLAACAVYPALRWDVTVFLGHRLRGTKGGRLLEQATLLKLARLPWFRHGRMPDWLRARLLRGLDGGRERPVREALEALLLSHLERPASGVPLDFARDAEQPSRRRRRKLLRGLYGSLNEQSPLFDYVFLTFMSERKPDPLELELPDAVSRALARHETRPFGLSPKELGVAAVVLALLAFQLLTVFRPQVNYVAVVPTFSLAETSGAINILPSAEPLSAYYTNLRRFRAQAFETLLGSGFFGDGNVTLADLDAETVDAYALRPAVYSAWLEDTLRRDVPDLDLASFRLTSLNINDAAAWRRERLYIEPVPTGVPPPPTTLPVYATPTPPPGVTPTPTPRVIPTPRPRVTPARPRPTPNPSPGPTRTGVTPTPTPLPAWLIEGSPVIYSLAQVTDGVKVSAVLGVVTQVSPPDILERSLAGLGVDSDARISAFKVALLNREPQLRGSIEKVYLAPADTVREVIRKVKEASAVSSPPDDGRAPQQQSAITKKVYILYDEANKATAQAAEQALREAGFKHVQSFVSYTLARPQGTVAFRPQAGTTAPFSVTYFNDGARPAARDIQAALAKIAPVTASAAGPASMQRDAYFSTFIRINNVDVQVSLLSPNAWRGMYGQTPRPPVDLAAEALRDELERVAPEHLAEDGTKWADYPLSHFCGGDEGVVDTVVSNAAAAFFKGMGWQLTPEVLSRLRATINKSTTARSAAEVLSTARMSPRQQGPPKAN